MKIDGRNSVRFSWEINGNNNVIVKYDFLCDDKIDMKCVTCKYIVTCQAHPVLVKKVNQMCGSFLFGGSPVGLVHLWTYQRIPGPVSWRCPGGLLGTTPHWHTTRHLTFERFHAKRALMA